MKGRLREPISGLTHLVGGLLALVALIVLLTKAAGRVDQLVAFGISGLSLVALYGASALYHLLPVSPPTTARLRRLDAPRWLSVGIYLAMGWLAVIAASAIFRAMPAPLEALHVHRHPSSLPQLGLRVGGPSRAAP